MYMKNKTWNGDRWKIMKRVGNKLKKYLKPEESKREMLFSFYIKVFFKNKSSEYNFLFTHYWLVFCNEKGLEYW